MMARNMSLALSGVALEKQPRDRQRPSLPAWVSRTPRTRGAMASNSRPPPSPRSGRRRAKRPNMSCRARHPARKVSGLLRMLTTPAIASGRSYSKLQTRTRPVGQGGDRAVPQGARRGFGEPGDDVLQQAAVRTPFLEEGRGLADDVVPHGRRQVRAGAADALDVLVKAEARVVDLVTAGADAREPVVRKRVGVDVRGDAQQAPTRRRGPRTSGDGRAFPGRWRCSCGT